MEKIFTVTLPDIGEGVVEGEVIEWIKELNTKLEQDEPVVIVMTDKATVELPAPYPGKLVKIYYQPGEIAIRGKPLYDIELDEALSCLPTQQKSEQIVNLPLVQKKAEAKIATCAQGKALATPATRKIARDLGLDLSLIQGSGSHGEVTFEDIKRHYSHSQAKAVPPLAFPDDQIEPLIGIRQLMAQKMALSKRFIPHFSYFEQVEATRLVKLRQKVKEEAAKEKIHVTYMPFLIRALSLTLKQYPLFNSSLEPENQHLRIHQPHNIGIAMATKLGLIVAVLKHVEKMSLAQIVRAYEQLKNRAVQNRLSPNDMKDSTITISNFGVLGGGGLWATPIINYPEAAILAVSKIQKQPLVINGSLELRDTLNLSWSFDHRIIDGDMAAAFSHYYATLIQNPAPLL
ncbi:Lipoamide acyltransferase component of branched-chain alpha-keto acid dehydrogenase complex [Parachlamydia sp. AcF125]|nr:Lipoamide acyltransferase component of branched-chain alpha-keto acid dehydrogenase complex [Parachlamydia sp. AcF125]